MRTLLSAFLTPSPLLSSPPLLCCPLVQFAVEYAAVHNLPEQDVATLLATEFLKSLVLEWEQRNTSFPFPTGQHSEEHGQHSEEHGQRSVEHGQRVVGSTGVNMQGEVVVRGRVHDVWKLSHEDLLLCSKVCVEDDGI